MNENLFPVCAKHREHHYNYISINYQDRHKLLCENCLKEIKHNQYFDLAKALNCPDEFISAMHDGVDETLFKAFKFSKIDLEKEYIQQITLLDNMFQNIKQCMLGQLKGCQEIQKQIEQCWAGFLKKFKYNDFQNLVNNLLTLDSKSDEYQQVEKQIAMTTEFMRKNKQIFLEFDQTKEIFNYSEQFIQKQKQNEKEYTKQICHLFQNWYGEKLNKYLRYSLLLTNAQLESFEKKIEGKTHKRIKQKSLIYVGSKDGLKFQNFWNNIEGRKNLFMIFKSKSENICGAYSPCKWIQNKNDFVQDDSESSFLYSLKHNSCFEIKKDQKQTLFFAMQNMDPHLVTGIQQLIQILKLDPNQERVIILTMIKRKLVRIYLEKKHRFQMKYKYLSLYQNELLTI